MSAIALQALLPEFGELTPPVAERWIAAALAVARALHQHDAWLYPVDPARLSGAERLHDVWRRWAEDADALLRTSEALAPAQIPNLALLRDEVGQIQSMLGMSPKLIAQRHEQALRGEVRPLEEVRRELRAGDRR